MDECNQPPISACRTTMQASVPMRTRSLRVAHASYASFTKAPAAQILSPGACWRSSTSARSSRPAVPCAGKEGKAGTSYGDVVIGLQRPARETGLSLGPTHASGITAPW